MSNGDLKRALVNLHNWQRDRSWIVGRLGRVNSDGTVTIEVSGKPDWVHVRMGPNGKQGNHIALNLGVALRAHRPVRMLEENGILIIHGVDPSGGSEFGSSGNVPTHTHRIGSGLEYEIEMLRLEAGRVRPYSGMTVHINAFRYRKTDDTWDTWGGGILDLTSFKPSNAGNHAWVLVGIDPSDNSAVAVKGDEYGYVTPLTVDLIDDINFGDYIPCGAVRVRQDDTALSSIARYQDAHGWFGGSAREFDNTTTATVSSTPYEIDWDAATLHELTLETSPTFSFSNLAAGKSLTLMLIQGGTGSHTVTWPGSVDWPNGVPTLDTAAAAIDVITLFVRDDGSTVEGFSATEDVATTDEKVKVSANDTTADYLISKLAAGSNITITETDDGSDESVTIAASGGGGGGTSKTVQARTVLHSETLAASGRFDVSSISQDYDHLEIRALVRSDQATAEDFGDFFLNGDTTDANYRALDHQATSAGHSVTGSDAGYAGSFPGASAPSNYFGIVTIFIPLYTETGHEKVLRWETHHRYGASNVSLRQGLLHWESTAAVNQITLQPGGHPTDEFIIGSYIEIVGIKEEALGGAAESIANVSNPPTDAELDSEFGTPASVGAGFLAILDDNGADTNVYFVASNGTSWWYTALTKAA